MFLARQESLAPATYNRRPAALCSFIRWLRTQGWQIEEILEKMERKPEGKQIPRALDAQRVESLLRHSPTHATAPWLIYDGGLRCQEALAIDIEDISWPDRSIVIQGKGDRPREMFFSRAVGHTARQVSDGAWRPNIGTTVCHPAQSPSSSARRPDA